MTSENYFPVRPLGDVSENHDSGRVPVKASERKPGPFPYYGAQGIVDYVDGYLFDGEFALVAEDGENLRSRQENIAFMARGRFWVNNHAHILRGNRLSDTRFLCYAINHLDISGYITGSTIPKLSQRSMNSIPIPLPPLVEQRAISALLGALDDKIDLNRRMNETVEAMARALFKDWFVDFGPVRAKAEACPPYFSPDLWSLFPDKLDKEDKPMGWERQPISTFASLVRDAVMPSAFPDELFDHYSIPAYDAGCEPKSDFGSSILSNKTVVPNEGVLLSKLNPDIPRVWMTEHGRTARGVCSTEFLALVSHQYVGREFLYSVLVEDGFRQRLQAMVTGTSKSHQRVSPQSVLNLEIVFPSPPVIGAFKATARPLFDHLLGNRREIRTLAALRDLLLPKLMSGEIRLKDAEQALEAVA